jgi:hypothetical protein
MTLSRDRLYYATKGLLGSSDKANGKHARQETSKDDGESPLLEKSKAEKEKTRKGKRASKAIPPPPFTLPQKNLPPPFTFFGITSTKP